MSINETGGSISDAVRQRVVEQFATGWSKPEPHAWNQLLADDVDLRQPLMPHGVGPDHWRREFTHLQNFLPDIRGEVLGWAGAADTIYLEVECRATAGNRPLRFRALDRLTISNDGAVTARTSYFDPLPLLLALATRPTAWPRWWRSGMAPLVKRRALLTPTATSTQHDRASDSSSTARAARGLGAIRTGVGLIALLSPRTAYRSLNPRADTAPVGGFMARAFGIREIAIAALALSKNPARARLGLQLGLLVDSIDTMAIVCGRKQFSRIGHLLIGLPAAAFAITGATALMTEHPRTDTDHRPLDQQSIGGRGPVKQKV